MDLITDLADLQSFAGKSMRTKVLGIDTEFVRERTYYARLCLLQVSDGNDNSCIDPLALDGDVDLDSVAGPLADPGVVKLFHAARQDLEVLYQRLGFVVGPVFDTQLAAAMCGYGDQVGYAALVERVTGTLLAKEETRTDWSRRPLSEAQIQYALDDVRHLHDLYEDLGDTLDQRGRLDWLIEENAAMMDESLYFVAPEDAWQRIKGLGSLSTDEQHRAAAIARWREGEARDRDLPREWVLRDRSIVEAVRTTPSSVNDLEAIDDVGKRTVERYGDVLMDMLNARVENDQPLVTSSGRPDREFNEMRKKMMACLRERAEAVRIAPSLLGNRDAIEKFIRSTDGSRLLEGWRREIIGDSLLEIRGDYN